MDEFFVRNRLSAYIDGDLPAAEARDVEDAISRVPALRAEYDALRGAVNLLRDHGPVGLPPGFEARLGQRLSREPLPTPLRRWVSAVRPERIMLAALAAAALLFVGLYKEEAEPPAVVATATTTLPDPQAVPETTPTPPLGDFLPGTSGFAAAKLDAERKLASGPPPGAVVDPGGAASLTPGSPRGSGSPSGAGGQLVSDKGVVIDPYLAPYESDADVMIVGSQVKVKAGGAADPKALPPAGVSVYSPPPFRYRVRSGDETMLKQLAAAAASVGGRLTDGAGRAIPVRMLESEEIATIRVMVPSESVEALTAKLRAIGDLEMMAADRDTVYATGTDVPVEVELERQ